jgi:hypothetical protein
VQLALAATEVGDPPRNHTCSVHRRLLLLLHLRLLLLVPLLLLLLLRGLGRCLGRC